MKARTAQAGFTVVELLIALAIMLFTTTALAQLMTQSSRINKSQQLNAQVQSNARNTLAMLEQRLRSAGWDPLNVGLAAVTLDPDLTDDVSELEVFADLNNDGTTVGLDEQVLIRHQGDRVAWRRGANVILPFEVVAAGITNDADGDGTPEPMFVPDSVTNPRRITIRITASSPVRDPSTGDFIRYTVSSTVVLRRAL